MTKEEQKIKLPYFSLPYLIKTEITQYGIKGLFNYKGLEIPITCKTEKEMWVEAELLFYKGFNF